MNVIFDTNVLVRATVQDDRRQSTAAARLLHEADTIVVTLQSLCEFVWVLRSVYEMSAAATATSIENLVNARNVVTNRQAVELGLTLLKGGGDFADGVIAFEGVWLGGETFATFDKRASALLRQQGHSVHLMR